MSEARWFDVLEQRVARVLHLAGKLNDGSWPKYSADHLHLLITRGLALESAPPKAGLSDPREVKRALRALKYAHVRLTQLDYMLISFCYGEAVSRFSSSTTLSNWFEDPADEVLYSLHLALNQYLVSKVRDEALLEPVLTEARTLLGFRCSKIGKPWRQQLESLIEEIWIHGTLEAVNTG